MSIAALEQHLQPLKPFLTMQGVTEICINQPGQIFVEQEGKFTHQMIPTLTHELLLALAILIAEFNHRPFPAPLLSGTLPTGERVQIVSHPACEKDKIVYAIRCHQQRERSLEDYAREGAWETVSCNHYAKDNMLLRLFYQQHDIFNFLKLAINMKKNILISGSTGAGKTTFLNACLQCIPRHERLITLEDTREVFTQHPNAVHLLFNEQDKQCTALKLFTACLRLRPDRILLSELRGAEVWPYLRAANSGHPGSLSTIHADSPTGALTQLVWMVQQTNSTVNDAQIRHYIHSAIHIVVQLQREMNPHRFICISEVYLSDAETNNLQ
jgi:type IV secretion system protein VirB11